MKLEMEDVYKILCKYKFDRIDEKLERNRFSLNANRIYEHEIIASFEKGDIMLSVRADFRQDAALIIAWVNYNSLDGFLNKILPKS